MHLIELSDYCIDPIETGIAFPPFDFFMDRGDAVSIVTDSDDDTLIFLKALATIIRPLSGVYRYKGEILNFANYRELLSFKKQIGYITSHAALFSNRTLRENLLFMRSYFSNTLSNELDLQTQELCDLFSLETKLDLRPTDLADTDYLLAIVIRELTKSPEMLLIEYPEKFIGLANLEAFTGILFNMFENGTCMVFVSEHENFIETFAKRQLVISKRKITPSNGWSPDSGRQKNGT